MKEFGKEYIKFRRLELNLSIRKLSKKTGIPIKALCNLEKGNSKRFKLSNMIKLCNILDIDLLKLIDVDENFIVISKYFHDVFA